MKKPLSLSTQRFRIHDYYIWVRFFELQYAEQACFTKENRVQ